MIDYRSKGGRRERQPLPVDVKAVIDDYLAADRLNRKETKTDGADAFIFQAEAMRRNFGASQPLSTRHIWHIVKTRGVQAGLGKLAPHDLRRTAILNMSKHKSVETLMIYNKGLENLKNNAVHTLNYDSE